MARSPEAAPMESADEENVWTSEKFLALKREFLEAKSEVAAFDVLQRLISIDQTNIDENAWLDCKDLVLALLENIPVDMMLLRQQMALLQAVNNSPPHVVSTLADFYARKSAVSCSPLSHRWFQATSLLRQEAVAISVAFARRINHTETYEAVSKLLAPLAGQQEVRGELFHQLTTSTSAEHRFRLYQLLLATFREKTYHESLFPFFDFLIKDLTRNDVLTQLATMDFLADLAIVSREAADMLNKMGVIEQMRSILQHGADSPDGGFLFTAAVKFFGCLSHCYPEVIDSVPDFVPIVMNMVHHYDSLEPSQRLLAADTFSHLAFTAEAKSKLDAMKDSIGLATVLGTLSNATRIGPVELRSRTVDAINVFFEHFVDDAQFAHWLGYMITLPSILTSYVATPFPETRMSTIRLLTTILSREKGVEVMLSGRDNIEQFKEWLCDPDSELEWVCCQLKNDLVRSLRALNWSVVDLTIKEKLKHYFDAPKAHPEVATLEL